MQCMKLYKYVSMWSATNIGIYYFQRVDSGGFLTSTIFIQIAGMISITAP